MLTALALLALSAAALAESVLVRVLNDQPVKSL
jgi:hypothetical protein